jgi:hypothetical protein
MSKKITNTTYGTELTSGSESDTDFKSTTGGETSEDPLDTTVTDVQSHAVLGAEQSVFEISQDLISSSAAAASSVTFRTPLEEEEEEQEEVTSRTMQEAAAQVQLVNQPTVKTADDEVFVRRKIRIAWLIVLGSVTSVFCFPFGIFGLIFAGEYHGNVVVPGR